MVTRYPASIDNSSTLPTVIDNVTGVHAVTVNILRDTAIAIEAQLGVKPAGLFSTVRARLDAMEALIQNAIIGEISFSGDLSGTVTHQTVIGLQTNPIQSGVLGPTQDGYVLTWNNGAFQWQAKPTANAFVGSGDLSGTATSQTVIGWENKLLDATTMGSPTDGYVPVWVAGSNRWKALSPESVIGELTLAGDVTGVANNNKVVALQHHTVASQTLGAGQDGYVLLWDNGDGYWHAAPNSISSGGVTPGTPGQSLQTNGTPASAWGTQNTVPLEFFGVTGTSDDGPVLQTAINAINSGASYRKGLKILITAPCTIATGVALLQGVEIEFGPGTFTLNAPISQQTDSKIHCSPGTILTSTITGTYPYTGSIIRAGLDTTAQAVTTLSADVVRGTSIISVTSAASIIVGGFVFLASNSTGYRSIFKVDNISGTTITLDRAVTQPFLSGDGVNAYNANQVCQRAELRGNGARVTAKGVVTISYQGAYLPRVSGLIFDSSNATHPSDAFGVFNNGTYGGYISDCYADGYTGGAPSVAFGFEGSDSCVGERLLVNHGAAYGFAFVESWNCTFRDCIATECVYGFVWQNDLGHATAGSDNCTIEGCIATGCSIDGFFVDWGANNAAMTDCRALYCAGYGFNIDGTGGGSGTRLSGCYAIGNTGGPWRIGSAALHTTMSDMVVDGNLGTAAHAADVTISGLRGTFTSSSNAGINISAGKTIISNLDVKHSGAGAAGCFTTGGGSLLIVGGRILLSTNGDIGIWMVSGAANVRLQDITISATGGAVGTYGIYAASGSAEARDCDTSGTATPFQEAGGTISVVSLSSTAETQNIQLVLTDKSSVTRGVWETSHGLLTAGGGGTDYSAVFGPRPAHPDQDAMLWLLPNGASPNDTNYAIDGNGSSLTFNALSANFNFAVGGAIVVANIEGVHGKGTFGGSGSDFKAVLGPVVGAETSTSALWLLSNGTSPSITNMAMYSDGASTVVNAQSGTGVIYLGYGSSLNSTISHLGVWNFAASQSPTLSQTAPGATSAGTDMTLAPQAGGATSGQPAALVFNIAAPNGGSAENYVKIERGGTLLWQLGPYTAFPTTFAAIYPGGVTPSAANYLIAGTVAGDNLSFNSSALIGINIANASKVVVDPTHWTFTGIANILFDPSITLPNITHSQSTTGSGQKLTIRAQDGYTTHPANGGNLFLSSGAKNSSGTDGYVAFLTGGNMGARISSASGLTGNGDGYVKVDNTGLLSFISTIGTGGITPGTTGQIFVTNSSPASVWTSLISYETTHGRFQAGGSGSDYKAIIGPDPGFETFAANLHLLAPATSPSSSNFAIQSDGFSVTFNAPGGTALTFSSANVTQMHINPSGLALAFDTIGNLTFAASIITPTYSQTAAASDVAPQNIIFRAQAPFASASVHLTTGHTVIDIPSSVGAGNLLGGMDVTYGGNQMISMGPYGGLSGGTYGYTALWFGGGTPGAGNYSFLGDQGQNSTYLNAGSNLYFAISGAVSAGHWRSTDLTLGSTVGSGAISFGYGTPAAPVIAFGFGGTGAVNATIEVFAPSNDVVAGNLILAAQGPFSSATVHKDPGNLQIVLPTPVAGSNFDGGVLITSGGHELIRMGMYNGDPTNGFGSIWFGGNAGLSNFGFLGNATETVLNSTNDIYLTLQGTTGYGLHISGGAATLLSTGSLITSFEFLAYNTATSVTFDQIACASDVAAADWTFQAQAPFASATVHVNPGTFIVSVPPPISGTSMQGGFLIKSGSSPLVRAGMYASGVTFGAVWLVDGGSSANNANFVIASNGLSTYLNGISGGDVFLALNAVTKVNVQANLTCIGGTITSNNGVVFDYTTATTPTILGGTNSTSLSIGTNAAAAITTLVGGGKVACLSVTAPGSTVGTGTTTITGAVQQTTRSSLTNFTIDTTTTDSIIRITATQTVTLPTPTVGRMLEIWLDGYAGVDVTLTLARHASEKINGLAASFIVTVSADPTGATGQTVGLKVRSIDGTNWLVSSG